MIVNKYKNGGGSGSGYTLPIASASILGGVKIGEGVDIDSAGTISVEAADSQVLLPSSALPQSVIWAEYQDNTFKLLRQVVGNDSEHYIVEWGSGKYAIVGASDNVLSYGSDWVENDGVYTFIGESGDSNLTSWSGDGKIYFKHTEDTLNFGVFGSSNSKEGGIETDGDENGSVRATTDGVYQLINNDWQEIAKASDLPTENQLLPTNGSFNYFLRMGGENPEWVTIRQVNYGDGKYVNGKVLKAKDSNANEYGWGDVDNLTAVSALPETCKDGNVYALANATGYGVYQAQGFSQDTDWVVPDDGSKGWTIARFPIDGQDCHIAFGILSTIEGGVSWNSDNSGEWSSNEFQFTSEYGNFTYTGEGWSMTGSTDGSYAYLQLSDGALRTYWISNTEIQIYLPNYVQIDEKELPDADYYKQAGIMDELVLGGLENEVDWRPAFGYTLKPCNAAYQTADNGQVPGVLYSWSGLGLFVTSDEMRIDNNVRTWRPKQSNYGASAYEHVDYIVFLSQSDNQNEFTFSEDVNSSVVMSMRTFAGQFVPGSMTNIIDWGEVEEGVYTATTIDGEATIHCELDTSISNIAYKLWIERNSAISKLTPINRSYTNIYVKGISLCEENFVPSSRDVQLIKKISQADYDDLVSQSAVSETTLYIIL